MRVCWNRQTGTFEGRVSTDVWVQVPSLAPNSTIIVEFLFLSRNKKGNRLNHLFPIFYIFFHVPEVSGRIQTTDTHIPVP